MEYTFFIDKIRKLRKEAGYTQEDVSRKLNIQRQTYCNYENGTRMPPLEIIIALADLYKLSVDALVRDGTPVLSPEPPQLTSYQATTIQTFLTLSEEKQKEAGDFIRFKQIVFYIILVLCPYSNVIVCICNDTFCYISPERLPFF